MSLSYQLFQVIHMHGSHKIYSNGFETKTKANVDSDINDGIR